MEQEVAVPTASEAVQGARLDLMVHRPDLGPAIYLDVTIVSACVASALEGGAALRDGAAADMAVRRKRARYAMLSHLVPFVLEEHGRWGEDALAFARRVAPIESAARALALADLYQRVAVAAQRAAAQAIMAAAPSREAAAVLTMMV